MAKHKPASKKPQGQATRGKTAQNRLRRTDNFLIRYAPGLFTRTEGDFKDALYVDLGYGAEPHTTLESAARLRRLNPNLPILGVEIAQERVDVALPFEDEKTFFRLGGFNLPLKNKSDGSKETVRCVRAFNVLRQYNESQVQESLQTLAHYVIPGGLLLEGTSNPYGRVWVANVFRRTSKLENPWEWEALVFSTSFRDGFEPDDFQPVLPKNLIHRMEPGEVIYDFLEAWKNATRETSHQKVWGLRQWFAASALRLAEQGFTVETKRAWLKHGFLIWRRPERS